MNSLDDDKTTQPTNNSGNLANSLNSTVPQLPVSVLPRMTSDSKFLHQPSINQGIHQTAMQTKFKTRNAIRVGAPGSKFHNHHHHSGSPQIDAIAVNVHSESSSSESSNSSSDSSESSDSEDDMITTKKPENGIQSNIVSSSTPDIHISPHLKPATHGSHGLTYELPPITSNINNHPYNYTKSNLENTNFATQETQFTRVISQASNSIINSNLDSSTDSIQDMTAAVKRLVNDPTKISSVKLPESKPVPMTFRDRSKIVGDMTNDALALKHQSLNESYQNAIYDPDADKKSIVVNNVHFLTADIELRRHFEIIGTITRVTICKDRFTGKPAGRAYIQFHDSASVELAKALDQTNFNGRPITVSPKYNPNGPPSSNNTYSTNNTSTTTTAPRPAPAFRSQTSYVRPQRQSKYNWVNPALQSSSTPAAPSTTQ